MKLKDKCPNKLEFAYRAGISNKRLDELLAKLDELVAKYKDQSPNLFDVYNEIAGFCKNINEVVTCTIIHCEYCQRKFGAIFPESYKSPEPDTDISDDSQLTWLAELYKKAVGKLNKNDQFNLYVLRENLHIDPSTPLFGVGPTDPKEPAPLSIYYEILKGHYVRKAKSTKVTYP